MAVPSSRFRVVAAVLFVVLLLLALYVPLSRRHFEKSMRDYHALWMTSDSICSYVLSSGVPPHSWDDLQPVNGELRTTYGFPDVHAARERVHVDFELLRAFGTGAEIRQFEEVRFVIPRSGLLSDKEVARANQAIQNALRTSQQKKEGSRVLPANR